MNNETKIKNERILVASVMCVMFLAAIENMITSTIIPSVISTLGGLSLYPWISSIFMLASTITIPIYGKLSDMYGHKNFTIIAITIFVLGSALCGIANTMTELIIYRAIQGMGAGGLVTMSYVMFGIIFPKEKRAKMQGLLSSVWALASVIGPILGSFFVEYFSWRWAFLVNVPVGMLAGTGIIAFYNIKHEKHIAHSIDYLGLLLFSTGIFSLLFSLLRINQGIITNIDILLLITSIILLILLVRHEIKVKEPIFPVDLFKDKVFKISVLMNFFAAFSLFSSINFLPLFIQGAMGYSPATTGRALIFIAGGWTSGSILFGRLFNKIQYKKLILFGTTFMTIGFILISFIEKDTSLWIISILSAILGFGMGFIATGTIILVQLTAPKTSIGSATSGIQLFRNIGGTMGITILGAIQVGSLKKQLIQNSNLSNEMNSIIQTPHIILDPISRANFSNELISKISEFLAISINTVFFIAFFVSFLSIIAAFKLPNLDINK